MCIMVLSCYSHFFFLIVLFQEMGLSVHLMMIPPFYMSHCIDMTTERSIHAAHLVTSNRAVKVPG